MIDYGAPIDGNEVVIEPFNDTTFNAVVTFHCKEDIMRVEAVCGSNGEWIPNPSLFKCRSGTLGT